MLIYTFVILPFVSNPSFYVIIYTLCFFFVGMESVENVDVYHVNEWNIFGCKTEHIFHK